MAASDKLKEGVVHILEQNGKAPEPLLTNNGKYASTTFTSPPSSPVDTDSLYQFPRKAPLPPQIHHNHHQADGERTPPVRRGPVDFFLNQPASPKSFQRLPSISRSNTFQTVSSKLSSSSSGAYQSNLEPRTKATNRRRGAHEGHYPPARLPYRRGRVDSCWQIQFQAQHETERTFHIYADTADTLRMWVKVLMKATITRDFTSPVMSSNHVATVPLDVARRTGPRPPSVIMYKTDELRPVTGQLQEHEEEAEEEPHFLRPLSENAH
ncbi:hypothetical protein BCR43DRAFT_518736 [Syncephalastrum racemosum]|uniref:PH domain-containing protein n=1 Tax=Syncephalastrum racemosum TaxID=13706 RepID=A0A1X2H1V8_SYNRA|nr:hypothetical protein BCR43DRAFT_518736 [Syncephalastrum racemosum]